MNDDDAEAEVAEDERAGEASAAGRNIEKAAGSSSSSSLSFLLHAVMADDDDDGKSQ